MARQWNEQLLDAKRKDFVRPTVHARNLFHTSVLMYDASGQNHTLNFKVVKILIIGVLIFTDFLILKTILLQVTDYQY